MKKWMKKEILWSVFFSGILGAVVALLVNTAETLVTGDGKPKTMLLCAAAVFLLSFLLLGKKPKRILKICGAVLAAAVAVVAVIGGIWFLHSRDAAYQVETPVRQQLFGGRKVLVIVPHQDDELNLMGGVLEEYILAGSEVYVAFVTNGDNGSDPEMRMSEALAALELSGIDADHTIFLGYGDNWSLDGPHICNAPAGMQMVSAAGRLETYGTSVHSAFREGRAYTFDNYLQDMETLILEIRPDVIFCSDYDAHIDHRAVSQIFERAMGRILNRESAYRPVVFKGYAYATGWEAAPDFLRLNVLGATEVYTDGRQRVHNYNWEERVRFPVSAESLGRSLAGSTLFAQLLCHESQRYDTIPHALNVISGDRIFWQRRTDSPCLGAQITVSSGNGGLLNDFMLLDDGDLRDDVFYYDGVWLPESSDAQRMAEVVLEKPVALETLTLYDHPDPEENITDIRITLDDGTVIHSGPLNIYGTATAIDLGGREVASFTLEILQWEGTAPGLSEIEGWPVEAPSAGGFIKLMDGNGEFVYDYWTAPSGVLELQLYAWGDAADAGPMLLETDNPACAIRYTDGGVQLTCPRGESCRVTVSCGEYTDAAYIENPSVWQRGVTHMCQWVESRTVAYYQELFVYRLFHFREFYGGKLARFFS